MPDFFLKTLISIFKISKIPSLINGIQILSQFWSVFNHHTSRVVGWAFNSIGNSVHISDISLVNKAKLCEYKYCLSCCHSHRSNNLKKYEYFQLRSVLEIFCILPSRKFKYFKTKNYLVKILLENILIQNIIYIYYCIKCVMFEYDIIDIKWKT